MVEVYINKTASYFPNKPIANDQMELYLGRIDGKPSKSKPIVLRNNGIESRFYALDENRNSTHTNAELTATAIRNLFTDNPEAIKSIDMLSCGTTTPDQLLPSHAIMVHGLLPETNNIEVVSNSGSCCSGMHAFKYAYLSVKSGEKTSVVCAGSERVSAVLKSELFEEEVKTLEALDENPYIAFEKDFLRWMLSDGAGAFLLENKKNDNGISLKVEWVELFSFANQMEPCMYMGAEKNDDGSLNSYLHYTTKEIGDKSVLSLKQDVKILKDNIVQLGFNGLKDILDRRGVAVEDIDYLLPHMSSYFFKSKIYETLENNNIAIPYDKWYTNLKTKGNIGAGSIYIMLDGLIESGVLKSGDKLLLAVPESARFSYAFSLLTVC